MQNRTLSTTQSEKIRNVLAQIDPEAVKSIDTYAGDDVQWLKDNWSELVTDPIWNENFESIDELIASPKSKLESIYTKNPEGLTPEQINQLVNKYDITTEDIADYYDFRKAQKEALDKFNASRYPEYKADYDKAQRAKSDSYYMSPLANEYAKEAYLKGDEKMARYNEAAGKVAGISDFAPLPWSLIGPVIRTAQRAQSDRKFTIGEAVADFAGAVVPDVAEKPARFAWNSLKNIADRTLGRRASESKVAKALEARIKAADRTGTQAASSDLAKIDASLDVDKLTDKQIVQLYGEIEDSNVKAALQNVMNARQAQVQDNLDYQAALELMKAKVKSPEQYASAKKLLDKDYAEILRTADEATKDANYKLVETYANSYPSMAIRAKKVEIEPFAEGFEDLHTFYKDVPLGDIANYEASKVKPSKVYDALYNVLAYGGRKAGRSMVGGRLNRWDMFDPTANVKDEDAVIKDVISLYAKEWKPYVKPANYDTDPLIKAAYDKWSAANAPYEFKVWRNQ